MFAKFSRSWELVKASAGVLRSDKELLIFPVISGIAALIVLATFVIPIITLKLFEGGTGPLGYVIGFLFYLCQYFVIFFFNSALVGAAMIRLNGGDPTVADVFAGKLATEGELGYWPGCDAIDKGAADIAAAMALFERVGLEHVKIVEAPQACAGYPLLAAGHRDLFRWHAGRVAASLRGFKKVAVNCSACLYAMRAQYAAEGVNLRTEIVSLADVLAPAAQDLSCSMQRRTVYYHDPCYHARYNGVVEQPRRALSSLAEVRELAWNKTDTECCGGGGLLPKTMPLVADQMAKRRLAEVQAMGGGMVVTSCATCTFMLKRNAPPSVEVANLATAMAKLSETPFTAPTGIPDADEG